MTWEDYYDRFYDWSESTQISRISGLTDFGASDEVCEIAQALPDEKSAARLIRKALTGGVRFSVEEINTLLDFLPESMYPDLIKSNAAPYSEDDLDYFCGIVDDKVIEALARKDGVPYRLPFGPEPAPPRQKGPGFFAALGAAIAGVSLADRLTQKKHSGRCDGNCASCPPHYGYRYGRWYYGHDHSHGCEFCGNKGSGSRD